MRLSSNKFDWIAYLLPVGMLIAPLAYYHDHKVHLQSLKVPGTNVLVSDCQTAARDSDRVIHVTYLKGQNTPQRQASNKVDPAICLPD